MNKTLLRTTIFAVASVSFAMVAQAQMQDGAMGGMATRGGMANEGGMSHSSMRHGSMHKRSMKMRKSGHMNRRMMSHGNM